MAPLTARGHFCNWSAVPKSSVSVAFWRLRFPLVGRRRISQVGFSDCQIDHISGTLLEVPAARRIRSQRLDMTLTHHQTAYPHPSQKVLPWLWSSLSFILELCGRSASLRSQGNHYLTGIHPGVSAYHLQGSRLDEVSFPPHRKDCSQERLQIVVWKRGRKAWG